MMMTTLWFIAPCSLTEVDRRFRCAYCPQESCHLEHTTRISLSCVTATVTSQEAPVNFHDDVHKVFINPHKTVIMGSTAL
jgi:hypothetical protein